MVAQIPPHELIQLQINSLLDDHPLNLTSVNYHLIKACNYRCRFCFAHFNQVEQNYLPKIDSMKLISMLAEKGTSKITFVGGEPTLVPFLDELVKYAKSLGMTTMIVTNGSKITQEYIDRFERKLDWAGLSIDSAIETVSKQLGRGTGNHVAQTLEVANLLKANRIRVKLNTVVTSQTWQEDMNWLIAIIQPERWKVFQMLPIQGENDAASDLLLTREQYLHFIEHHKNQNPVIEDNDAMLESYLMIDPEGRFFSNSGNKLTHSRPILEVGISEAISDIRFIPQKLVNRGGIYSWRDQTE